jgi:LmbE family N-acetylglucosaminyl deacetylase
MIGVVSPHLDDAVFSVAEHMIGHDPVTIICPFGGVPEDEAGRTKYLTLLTEHADVCNAFGWGSSVGPFLDDVYIETRSIRLLDEWLSQTLKGFDEVWFPFGIHHPDHRLVAKACRSFWNGDGIGVCVYEELPYRVLYPDLSPMHTIGELLGYTPRLEQKKAACRTYASQINDDIERCLYVPERLWRVR